MTLTQAPYNPAAERIRRCFEIYKTLLQNPHITQSVMALAEEMTKEQRTTHDDTFKEMQIEAFHKLMTEQAVRHVDLFSKNYNEIEAKRRKERDKEPLQK